MVKDNTRLADTKNTVSEYKIFQSTEIHLKCLSCLLSLLNYSDKIFYIEGLVYSPRNHCEITEKTTKELARLCN